MDIETINKADSAFNALRPTVDVEFEDIATTCARVIEKASCAESLTDEHRDAVKRAHAVMKMADSGEEDIEKATIDEELWGCVQKDAEGAELGISPPSVKISTLAKSWNSENGGVLTSQETDTPVADADMEDSNVIKSMVGMGDLNDIAIDDGDLDDPDAA